MNEYQQTPSPEPQQPSGEQQDNRPRRAGFFALIPGLGAVYNRQYMKAVLHFAIFAGLIELSDEVEVFVLATIAFYVFQMMDAYRSATAIAETQPADASSAAESELNLPLWGGALVLMGVVLLLDTLGAIRLSSLATYWPILFILLGLYLIYVNMSGKKTPQEDDRGAPVRTAGPAEDPARDRPEGP